MYNQFFTIKPRISEKTAEAKLLTKYHLFRYSSDSLRLNKIVQVQSLVKRIKFLKEDQNGCYLKSGNSVALIHFWDIIKCVWLVAPASER